MPVKKIKTAAAYWAKMFEKHVSGQRYDYNSHNAIRFKKAIKMDKIFEQFTKKYIQIVDSMWSDAHSTHLELKLKGLIPASVNEGVE